MVLKVILFKNEHLVNFGLDFSTCVYQVLVSMISASSGSGEKLLDFEFVEEAIFIEVVLFAKPNRKHYHEVRQD